MEVLEIDENITYPSTESNNGLIVDSIARIDNSISYEKFFSEYILKNQPCIIEKGIVNNWPCAQQWSLNNAPNFQYLRQHYGNHEVPVANCNMKYFNVHPMKNMTMNKFINYWEEFRKKNYPKDMFALYLKDWHCLQIHPNNVFYTVPKYFASDWLNEYYLAHPQYNDDYMFVYMGPKRSWTPLHADVFRSYSWSTNIVGKKRWLLFPPGEEDYLDDGHGNLFYDVEHPDYSEILSQRRYLDVIQNAGEIIFVPSGWHHQVWNLEDTISINHNWLNGCNINNAWMGLKDALESIMKEIEDCSSMENWVSHCQVFLRTSHGVNYRQFFHFLCFIIDQRLEAIIENTYCTIFDIWNLGTNHMLFDLERAKEVLIKLMIDCREKDLYDIVFAEVQPENVIRHVDATLKYHNRYISDDEQ